MIPLRPTLAALGLPLVLLGLPGCVDTDAAPDLQITDGLVEDVTRGSLMLGALAVELALNVSEPPPVSGCPSGIQDQDSLTLNYGAGCLPESGLFELGLLGSASFTLAGGSGVFVGEVTSLGFPDLPLLGSVSGQVSRAGDLVSADLEFSDLVWTDSGLENRFDGLFELSIDGEDILLNLAAGRMLRGGEPHFRVDLEDIVPAPLSMGPCWLPISGQATLERDQDTAMMTFTETTGSNSEVEVEYGSRDPAMIEPCD